MIHEIKPNIEDPPELHGNELGIFLAGSIEMGSVEKWGSRVIQTIKECNIDVLDIIFFNPRRDDWDSSWIQEQSNPQFNYQVNWELNKLDECDIVFMYFSPETKSPISLLELGRYAGRKEMIVCCPSGFWRRGNVEILCTRTGTQLFEKLEDAVGALLTKINQYQNERN